MSSSNPAIRRVSQGSGACPRCLLPLELISHAATAMTGDARYS